MLFKLFFSNGTSFYIYCLLGFKLVLGGFSNPITLSGKKCEVQLEFQLEKNGTQKPTEKVGK